MGEHGIDLAREMLSLKEAIQNGKERYAKLQGEYESLTARLNEDFAVKSIKAGEELVMKMEQGVGKINKLMESKIKEVQEMLGEEKE